MPAHILDPITLSTVWHNMQSYCREMKHVITRTAQSILIAHLGDDAGARLFILAGRCSYTASPT